MAKILDWDVDPTDHNGSGGAGDNTKNETVTIHFDEAMSSGFMAERVANIYEGVSHPDNSYFVLDAWSYHSESERVWVFNLTYRAKTGKTNSTKLIPFEWEETREIVHRNTVGDPIFPGEQDTKTWPAFTVEYIKSKYDEAFYSNSGKSNSDATKIGGVSVPKYCAILGTPKIEPITIDEKLKWKYILPVRLCFRESETDNGVIGFQKEILNNGYRILENGEPVDIVDSQGNTPTSPQAINEAGTAVVAPGATPHYILKEPREKMSFSGLGIPTNKPVI